MIVICGMYTLFDKGKRALGMVVTKDFKGYVLFCFEKVKMTKIDVKGYETKQK